MSATASFERRDLALGQRLGRRRRTASRMVTVLCWLATALALLLLASILATLIVRGAAGLSLHMLTTSTRAPGSNGGLLNAIIGSLIQTGIGTALGTPVGLLVGTYLAEYARGSTLGNAVRFVSDILLSAPSILIGPFVYKLIVEPMGGFSGIAGGVALGIIVVPIVVRTTEDMLRLIPDTLREASIALGAPKWRTIVFVCYRAALDGIVLSVCRLGVRRLGAARLDRGAADHRRRAGDQRRGPRRDPSSWLRQW